MRSQSHTPAAPLGNVEALQQILADGSRVVYDRLPEADDVDCLAPTAAAGRAWGWGWHHNCGVVPQRRGQHPGLRRHAIPAGGGATLNGRLPCAAARKPRGARRWLHPATGSALLWCRRHGATHFVSYAGADPGPGPGHARLRLRKVPCVPCLGHKFCVHVVEVVCTQEGGGGQDGPYICCGGRRNVTLTHKSPFGEGSATQGPALKYQQCSLLQPCDPPCATKGHSTKHRPSLLHLGEQEEQQALVCTCSCSWSLIEHRHLSHIYTILHLTPSLV